MRSAGFWGVRERCEQPAGCDEDRAHGDVSSP
jgi:hypothetical protein